MKFEVIVPAYNEARTVAAVVEAALACPLVERVLVVDDGSRDGTAEAARRAGAAVHTLRPNQGKSAALSVGAAMCRAEVVALLDGDLLGLTPGHLEALASPVLAGQAEMSIGVFHHGRGITDLSQRLTPFLNGQRVLRRDLLRGLEGAERLRYAADTILSLYARRTGARVCRVLLPGVTHVMKEEKIGLARGVWSRLRMFGQVFLALAAPMPGVHRKRRSRA
ncbi:MAG: glycosyltransferase family 2 protein [Bacteroidota bacterium]